MNVAWLDREQRRLDQITAGEAIRLRRDCLISVHAVADSVEVDGTAAAVSRVVRSLQAMPLLNMTARIEVLVGSGEGKATLTLATPVREFPQLIVNEVSTGRRVRILHAPCRGGAEMVWAWPSWPKKSQCHGGDFRITRHRGGGTRRKIHFPNAPDSSR